MTVQAMHYKEVCQYGLVHGQCRCPSNDKFTRHVECDKPKQHAEMTGRYATEYVVLEGLTIAPDDTLLISAKHHMSREEADRVREMLKDQLPDNRVIVFDACYDLIKLEPADGSKPMRVE